MFVAATTYDETPDDLAPSGGHEAGGAGPVRIQPHWTPGYVADRLWEIAWRRLHPSAPWLTPAAVPRIERLLRPTDVVFEWGSGRSTKWFAQRTARITSIERNAEWHERVAADLRSFPDSRCVLLPRDEADLEAWTERYVSALGDIEKGPVDVVLVDGAVRDRCAVHAISRLAPGGMLIVDDVQRFLPSRSRTPSARADHASDMWGDFEERLGTWQRIWVSSGVTDTAIWLHPDGEPRGA